MQRASEASDVTDRFSFDGAKRASGKAAAGTVAIAYYSNGERQLLFRAGKLLGELRSAFLAESLAAEWCFELIFQTFAA